jgi:hypothetical protein
MNTSRCLTCAACGGRITGTSKRSAAGRPFHVGCFVVISTTAVQQSSAIAPPGSRSGAEMHRLIAKVERRTREGSQMFPNPIDPLTE